jgi:hypothetical protein
MRDRQKILKEIDEVSRKLDGLSRILMSLVDELGFHRPSAAAPTGKE